MSTNLICDKDWIFQILVMLAVTLQQGDGWACQAEHPLDGPVTVECSELFPDNRMGSKF